MRRRMQVTWAGIACSLLLFLLAWTTITAQASSTQQQGQGNGQQLTAGPYVVQVTLSPDPPGVEQPLIVTIAPHGVSSLSGRITANPGLGTDATPSHADLAATGNASGSLSAAVHLPVRGAWQLVIDLDGPRGHGTATLDVNATAPNAIPTWLGWLIGLSPLIGFAWLIRQQWKYRRRLLARTQELIANPVE